MVSGYRPARAVPGSRPLGFTGNDHHLKVSVWHNGKAAQVSVVFREFRGAAGQCAGLVGAIWVVAPTE
jgi:hypothetical protein